MSDSDTKGGGKVAKFNLNQLLNNSSLNKTMEEAEIKKENKFEVTSISVYNLIPSEENFYSVENITELKDSIEMFGIKQNLTVKAVEDGKFVVISGHRRRLASLALAEEGKKEFEFVPCTIENDLDYIKEQLLLITTNSTARQLSDWEKTQQAEKLKSLLEEYKTKEKLPGRVREIIAKILNTSSTQVARMDSISKNLTEKFKEEFKEEKINISTAYELSTLPEEAQKDIYIEHKESSISLNDVKEKKAEIKAAVIEEHTEETSKDVLGEDMKIGEAEKTKGEVIEKPLKVTEQKKHLNELFEMQRELDKHINEEHNLQGIDLIHKKVVAFIVELSELANEIRFFKFWSNKKKSHKNIILEEYIDGVHFLLSLGLEIRADNLIEDNFGIEGNTFENLEDEFLFIINLAITFRWTSTYENYRQLLTRYLSLGHILGFTEKEIFKAYISKNKVNHIRQEQGY